MKTRKLFTRALCLATSLVFAACTGGGDEPPTPPTPPPTPPTPPDPTELVDAMLFGDTKTDLKSMFSLEQEGMFYVYVSPEEVPTLEELIAMGDDGETPLHQYVMVAVENTLLGTTIDLAKPGDGYFALYNLTSTRSEFESVDADNPALVKGGTITVKKDEAAKKVTLEFNLTLLSDKIFAAKTTFPWVVPIEPVKNAYSVDGTEVELKSVTVMEYYGYIYLGASPIEGLATYDEIYDSDQSICVMFDPTMIGKTTDLLGGEGEWSFEAYIEQFPQGLMFDYTYASEEISAGTVKVEQAGTMLNYYLDFTTKAGVVFSMTASVQYEPSTRPDNFLEIESEVDEIRAAFWEDTADGSAIYLTTSDISDVKYPSEVFFDSKHTVVMKLADNLMVGDDWDIADARGFEFEFRFDYGDQNPNGEGYVHIVKAGELNGESGTFNVVKSGSTEGKFTITFDFNLGARIVKGAYTGVCLPYRVEKKNEYGEPNGQKKAIGSVLVDSSKTLCEIWIATESGLTTVAAFESSSDPVKIILPKDKLTGNPIGFSQEQNAAVVYKGMTYNYANGSMGTIYAKETTEGFQVEFSLKREIEGGFIESFLEGYYAGPAVKL